MYTGTIGSPTSGAAGGSGGRGGRGGRGGGQAPEHARSPGPTPGRRRWTAPSTPDEARAARLVERFVNEELPALGQHAQALQAQAQAEIQSQAQAQAEAQTEAGAGRNQPPGGVTRVGAANQPTEEELDNLFRQLENVLTPNVRVVTVQVALAALTELDAKVQVYQSILQRSDRREFRLIIQGYQNALIAARRTLLDLIADRRAIMEEETERRRLETEERTSLANSIGQAVLNAVTEGFSQLGVQLQLLNLGQPQQQPQAGIQIAQPGAVDQAVLAEGQQGAAPGIAQLVVNPFTALTGVIATTVAAINALREDVEAMRASIAGLDFDVTQQLEEQHETVIDAVQGIAPAQAAELVVQLQGQQDQIAAQFVAQENQITEDFLTTAIAQQQQLEAHQGQITTAVEQIQTRQDGIGGQLRDLGERLFPERKNDDRHKLAELSLSFPLKNFNIQRHRLISNFEFALGTSDITKPLEKSYIMGRVNVHAATAFNFFSSRVGKPSGDVTSKVLKVEALTGKVYWEQGDVDGQPFHRVEVVHSPRFSALEGTLGLEYGFGAYYDPGRLDIAKHVFGEEL